MSRAWELLRGKTAREVTGRQIEGVGASTFIQPENKAALREWERMAAGPELLTPKGGTIWADSMTTAAAELNNASLTLIPSTLYTDDPSAETYLCQLMGIYAYVGAGTSFITAEWNDGSNAVVFVAQAVDGSNILTFRPSTPLYFNEDMAVKITEAASNACNVRVCVAINKRGGNPQ